MTIVLLGDSNFQITGGTVDLSAPTINSTSSDLNGVLIDDQASSKSNNAVPSTAVTVQSGARCTFQMSMFHGERQKIIPSCSNGVGQLLLISGNAYMSTNNCAPATIAKTEVVALWAGMGKLDQRGVAALEFCLVAVPFFILMSPSILGHAINMQSLRMLANAGARAKTTIKCYTPAVTINTPPSGCTDIDTYFPEDPQRLNTAPFLYGVDHKPKYNLTLDITLGEPLHSLLRHFNQVSSRCRYGEEHSTRRARPPQFPSSSASRIPGWKALVRRSSDGSGATIAESSG